MAACLALGQYNRLHHFISDGIRDGGPLSLELALQADRMVGADDAFLVIDDRALPKKGEHSVTKPEIALEEVDRLTAADLRFGVVLADAGYGLSAAFRQGLSARGLV